jgi:hypothetical protein
MKQSFIKTVKFDKETQTLTVKMDYRDKYDLRTYKYTYEYYNLPVMLGLAVTHTDDVVKIFNKFIKDKFDYKRII